MKDFIVKSLVYGILVSLGFVSVLLLADGSTDAVYAKFTSPKQKGLIVGTSRANQGINPTPINKLLKCNLYNYAISLGESPYGPVYYKSILKKLDRSGKNEVFIVSVDPWCISSDEKRINDVSGFSEKKRCVGTTENVTSSPNLSYLFKYFKGNYYRILFRRISFPSKVHKNGWQEISIDMSEKVVEEKIKLKKVEYNGSARRYKFSSVRLEYLNKIIRLFKKHGKVYLVRLPINQEIMEIEKKYMPNFEIRIKSSLELADGYIDLTSNNKKYKYHDGNHLYKSSANLVSHEIAKQILLLRSNYP